MAKKASAVFYVTSVFPPLLSPALEAVCGDGVCCQHTAGTRAEQTAGAWSKVLATSRMFLLHLSCFVTYIKPFSSQ